MSDCPGGVRQVIDGVGTGALRADRDVVREFPAGHVRGAKRPQRARAQRGVLGDLVRSSLASDVHERRPRRQPGPRRRRPGRCRRASGRAPGRQPAGHHRNRCGPQPRRLPPHVRLLHRLADATTRRPACPAHRDTATRSGSPGPAALTAPRTTQPRTCHGETGRTRVGRTTTLVALQVTPAPCRSVLRARRACRVNSM
jgi:hypothetical protein